MDYGLIPRNVREYLEDMIGQTPQAVSEEFTALMDLYSRKLWHELTLHLELLVKSPYFDETPNSLLKLYEKFIKDFQDRINQLSLVNICLSLIRQYKDPQEALAFLETLKSKVKRSPDAYLTLIAGIAEIHIQIGDLATAKKELEEVEQVLETIVHVGSSHAAYYRICSDYYKRTGEFAPFYDNALKFLGCVDLATIPLEEQVQRAFDLGLAAMLAPTIYNFGELLAHPILDSLKGTDKNWLIDLLFAFNSGNIAKFTEMQPTWSQEADLVVAFAMMRQKISLLAVMELVFVSGARERGLSFEEVAKAAQLPVDEVEVLVMKALSLGLVRGKIDEVEQIASLTWVQPRVLDLAQLSSIKDRLRGWNDRIKSIATSVESQTPELFQSAFL